MSRKKIRCFAIDVDGTIADDKGRIDLEAGQTLRNLHDLGYEVIFVSGRSVWELLNLASYLGTSKIVVSENGGVIAVPPINIQCVGDITPVMKAYDVLSKKLDGVTIKSTMPRFTEIVLRRTFNMEKGQQILKGSNLPVRLIDSTFAYHITNNHVDKGKGLNIALKYLNIDPCRVIAIGDSDTDIPLFDACLKSIAVGNATKRAKECASFCVDRPLGMGLIDAISLSFQKILGPDAKDVTKK